MVVVAPRFTSDDLNLETDGFGGAEASVASNGTSYYNGELEVLELDR